MSLDARRTSPGFATWPRAVVGVVAEYTYHDSDGRGERVVQSRSVERDETVADLVAWADRRGGALHHLDRLLLTIDADPAPAPEATP